MGRKKKKVSPIEKTVSDSQNKVAIPLKGSKRKNVSTRKKNASSGRKKSVSRAGRTESGRKTKYYRAYVPRKRKLNKDGSVKKHKINPFIAFRSCFAEELRNRGLKSADLVAVTGETGFRSLSGVVSFVWSSLSKDEKKNISYLCKNTDSIFDRYFTQRLNRKKDIDYLRREFDREYWYTVRDSFIPSLFNSISFFPGDRVFLSGYVNSEIPFFPGKWLEIEKDQQVAMMFHERCANVFNAPMYKSIFRSPQPEMALLDIKENPDGSLWLFYNLSVNTGFEVMRGFYPDQDMTRDDTKDSEIKPELSEVKRSSKGSADLEIQLSRERVAGMKSNLLMKYLENNPKATQSEIDAYVKTINTMF